MSRKKRAQPEVEMNVTAMLDMAFQLLAFFVMTFQQPPLEGQIMMRLPPPEAILGAGGQSAGDNDKKDQKDVKPVETLAITLIGDVGGIKQVKIGIPGSNQDAAPIAYKDLKEKLNDYVTNSAGAFKQIVIEGSPGLPWEFVMQTMDTCSQQKKPDGTKIDKLSFACGVEAPK